MRKKKRNIIGNVSLWLAIPIFLVLSGLFTVGRAEIYGNFTYSTDGSSVTITKYTGSEANVSIPGFIRGTPVTSIGVESFYGCASLNSVAIPDNVNEIEGWAFDSCTSLRSVTIPNNVTNIGKLAFFGCSSLSNVIIGNRVISIGQEAFELTSLKSITIPASVTTIEAWAFQSCILLRSVCFEGNAPTTPYYQFNNDEKVTLFYLAGTTGWGPTFAGRPTALWIKPLPYQEWAQSTGLLDKYPAASGDMDDPDQDGMINYQEWQAGTDPTNPNSALKFELKPRLADLEDRDKTPLNPGEFALYFQTMPYRQYDIQSATSLGGTWQTEVTVTTTNTQKRILVYKGLDKALYRAVLVP